MEYPSPYLIHSLIHINFKTNQDTFAKYFNLSAAVFYLTPLPLIYIYNNTLHLLIISVLLLLKPYMLTLFLYVVEVLFIFANILIQ